MVSRVDSIQNLLAPGEWEIAIYRGDVTSAQEVIAREEPVCTLTGATGTYYADPIVFAHDGRTAVLFEKYVHASRHAHVLCQELDRGGKPIGDPRQIVETSLYMSFPHCAVIRGDAWMIPECAASGAIFGYRATSFPFEWAPPIALVSHVDAVDPTILVEDGVVYLLMSEPGGGGADDRSSLSVLASTLSEFPSGRWRRVPVHPGAGGRNAGPPFRRADGRWIRPAQVSSDSYGERIALFEIERIGTDGYREIEVGAIRPTGPGVTHLHTLSSIDGLFAIDRRRIGFRPSINAQIGRLIRLSAHLSRR